MGKARILARSVWSNTKRGIEEVKYRGFAWFRKKKTKLVVCCILRIGQRLVLENLDGIHDAVVR